MDSQYHRRPRILKWEKPVGHDSFTRRVGSANRSAAAVGWRDTLSNTSKRSRRRNTLDSETHLSSCSAESWARCLAVHSSGHDVSRTALSPRSSRGRFQRQRRPEGRYAPRSRSLAGVPIALEGTPA